MSESSDIEISDEAINDEMQRYLESRKDQMKSEFKKQELKFIGFGTLQEIDESVFIKNVTEHTYVVTHFYHPDFLTCQAMNGILEELAKLHYECKFIKVQAEKSPFFVNKLKIKTLPTLIVFKKGKLLRKFIGFEEFGMDKPDPELVLKGLGETGALELSEDEEKKFRRQGGRVLGFDDEGEDW